MSRFWINALGEYGRDKGKHTKLLGGSLSVNDATDLLGKPPRNNKDWDRAHRLHAELNAGEQEQKLIDRHSTLAFDRKLSNDQFRFYGSIKNGTPELHLSTEFMYYLDEAGTVEPIIAQLAMEFGASVEIMWDDHHNYDQDQRFNRRTGDWRKTPGKRHRRIQVSVDVNVIDMPDADVAKLREAMRKRVDTIGLKRDWVSVL